MKNSSFKAVLIAMATILTSAGTAISPASELSHRYGYVGVNPHVALAAPFGPAFVRIYDQYGGLLASQELSAGDTVLFYPEDLGLSGLSYVRIVSTEAIVCLIEEIPEDGEHGHTEPQSELFDTYSMVCPAPNSSWDDLFRIYAPRRTDVRVYDQDMRLIEIVRMERGEVREFNAGSDWGLSSPYAVVIRATKPIAVSFMDAPAATTLMIPQGRNALP